MRRRFTFSAAPRKRIAGIVGAVINASEPGFADLAAYVALPHVQGLAVSADGRRLVAAVQQPDATGSRYVSALWEIPLAGGEPVRLTRSEQGESTPAFRPDGSLVFVSTRPKPDEETDDEPALWVLPPAGEPRLLARYPGGLSGPVVARGTGAVLAAGSRLVGSGEDDDDAARRRVRAERKVTAILHDGLPIRDWDHELGAELPRLILVDGEPRDLTPDAVLALVKADYSISADGTTVATTWRERRTGGGFPPAIVLLDAAGGRRVLAAADGVKHDQPRISPDGTRVAVLTSTEGSFEGPVRSALRILPTSDGPTVQVALGNVYPTDWAWSPDSATLYVTGDRHGRGAVLAVDPATGMSRRLAADAAYTALCPAPDALYALRSAMDSPPTPVRLDPAAEDQQPVPLPTLTPQLPLPGQLEEVGAEVAGATVRGWLCRPHGEGPFPLMQWINGGPFASHNSWSWSWNPWVMVARGWAVLLPDPALSSGYGPEWIDRAWPNSAAPVWADIEGLLDAVVARPDIDGGRTACLGASFGGYLTNWVAGHTDRFGAIVTHAGTWALDQKNDTTDVAAEWDRWVGRPAEHPDWYAQNSPHVFADRIRTPMLVVHGNRDYRVPVSEALRLWFDLVRRWDGDPADLPHRFLNFTGQNHWITSPADAEVWYDTVLRFCGQHVLGQPWKLSDLL